jgi:hypothetical protein
MSDNVTTTDAARDFMATHVDNFERTADAYPYALPTQALRFLSVDYLRRAVVDSGSHFFDADTMRFFRSRVAPGLTDARFFITSEPVWGDDHRTYAVRWVYAVPGDDQLSVDSLSPRLDSLGQARTLARQAARIL